MNKTALFAVRKNEPCPQCGAELVIRSGKHGAFLGCPKYPGCDYVRPLKNQSDGHIVKVLEGQHCSECQAELVLRQGRYGMFIACSNYPECGHTELIDKPDETTLACPQCQQGKLVQRRSRYGKIFHACERYPDCQFAVNFTPVEGKCEFCHFPLLIEKKTARGVRRFCASKACDKPVTVVKEAYLPGTLDFCVEKVRQGAVIAYPTEAVFGLGCDPDNESAVLALLTLKQRPVEKGLILIAADYQQLQPYLDDERLSGQQKERMFACWPGPVTWVVPARSATPRWLTGRFDSLAVRISDHPEVRQLCQAVNKPLVSTSANLTTLPPCRTAAEVHQQFGKEFPVLLAKTGGRNNPSEIRDVLTGELIRQG